jgi:hypothetical protein
VTGVVTGVVPGVVREPNGHLSHAAAGRPAQALDLKGFLSLPRVCVPARFSEIGWSGDTFGELTPFAV